MFFPTLLIVIGFVWLLSNLGLIPVGMWSLIWPIILIVCGAFLVNKSEGGCSWCAGKCCSKKEDHKDESK